jgi:hypothetical protein
LRFAEGIPGAGGKAEIDVCKSPQRGSPQADRKEINSPGGQMSRRSERNKRIKRQITKLQSEGFSLKEALYIVADRWYLSAKHVERIYYETRSQ